MPLPFTIRPRLLCLLQAPALRLILMDSAISCCWSSVCHVGLSSLHVRVDNPTVVSNLRLMLENFQKVKEHDDSEGGFL